MSLLTLPEVDDSPDSNSPRSPEADWRSALDRFSSALVFEVRPWYVSLFWEIRDRVRPPKLPPLQVTSQPVEVQELEVSPWYVSLFREIRDRIRPSKLPPLQVTSHPGEVKELWGDYRYGKIARPVSLAIHIIAVTLLVGMQLYSVATKDIVYSPVAISLQLPPPPPPPAPAPPDGLAAAPTVVRRVVQPRAVPTAAALLAPPELVKAPPEPDPESAVPEGVVGGVPGGVVGGVPGGVVGGVIGEILSQMAPPPPVVPVKPPEPPPPPQRIEVSPELQEGKLLVMIRPDYPPLARRSRIQGAVQLKALISKDGAVSRIEVVEGHPLLIPEHLRLCQIGVTSRL